MEFVEVGQDGYDPGVTFSDRLLFGDLPDATNIYEVPPITTRVGEEYQAEIPPMLTESERLQLIPNCIGVKDMLRTEYHIEKGLLIPILWIQYPCSCKRKQPEGNSSFIEACSKTQIYQLNCSCCQVSGTRLDHRCRVQSKASAGNQNLSCQIYDDGDAKGSVGPELTLPDAPKACIWHPLPGSSVVSWSDAERQSFLLGLYIFGKNLIQVQKFMGFISMGDILSYYYSEFYRSDAYQRWLECRKARSRKCTYGHRIFTGSRQQELLSRLLCSVPEEVHGSLKEVTKMFSEGKTPLEEFISTLKATVGMQILIDAVGIGRGKDDLTGYNLDSGRSSQSTSVRSEIPFGKTFSSLASEDVIKFLTGDFRLSKAKSNDLFWEAVWPRLLARGWHSEQPKGLSFVKSKQGLVFLLPDVKRFSRRKLVKGTHYFDSISDLLNKVASDPKLLDLEVDGCGDSGNNNVCVSDTNVTLDDSGPSSSKQHFYLRPKYPANTDLMRFTIVDTSMSEGDASIKIREFRSLPLDFKHSHCPPNSVETESDSLEEQLDSTEFSINDQGQGETPTVNENILKEELQSEMSHCSVSKKEVPAVAENCDSKCFDLLKHNQPPRDIKFQFSRRPKPGQPESLTPVSKRRRLAACKTTETGRPTDSSYGDRMKSEETCLKIQLCNVSPRACLIALPAKESAHAVRVKMDGRNTYRSQGIGEGSNTEAMMIDEKPPVQSFLDLNFRPDSKISLEPETSSLPSETDKREIITDAPEICTLESGNNQSTMNTRRHSTRSRPLTVKALEALESGFLSPTRKWRDMQSDNSNSVSARRARKSSKVPDLSVKSDVSVGESSKILVVGNHLEYKQDHELFGLPQC